MCLCSLIYTKCREHCLNQSWHSVTVHEMQAWALQLFILLWMAPFSLPPGVFALNPISLTLKDNSSFMGFPGGTVVKYLSANGVDARDADLIPGSGRSPGGGNGNPLQYSCLENPMDSGAWWATVHRPHRVGHDEACVLAFSPPQLHVKGV